ncbi:MAG: aldo/keto reductase [Acidobacteriota bacterium]
MTPDDRLVLPRLGLGTVAFGRTWRLKYRRAPRLPTDAELDRLLGVAADLGVLWLDTAPAYGLSEERLGRLLRDRPDRFVVSTKVGEEATPDASRFDFRPAAIRASVERSLHRLRRDVLDLVFLHAGNDDRAALDGLDTLRTLQHRGLVRHVGASTKSVAGGLTAVERCDAVMLEYSLQKRTQEPVLEHAAGRCAVAIKKPLASGHVDDPAAALAFVAARPDVTSILVGTTSVDHLRANWRAVTGSDS